MAQINKHLACSSLIIAGISLGQFFLCVTLAEAQGIAVQGLQGNAAEKNAAQTNIELGEQELKQQGLRQGPCPDLQRFEVTVVNENKAHLDRQALVKLHDNKKNIDSWTTTDGNSQGIFCGIDFGDYEIDAGAVGYLTAHVDWHISGAIGDVTERKPQVVMHKDPTAVELIAPDEAIPASARKDAKRAVVALRSGNLKRGQESLDKALKLAPSNPQINFLYGYLCFQRKDFDKAETYLGRASILDPRRTASLTLLGRVQLERKEYEAGRKTLEQAVATNPSNWVAHYLLADVYLKLREYDKAREQAQLAIDQGRGEGSVARLVLGQALANVGRDSEAIQALKIFAQSNPTNTAIAQVNALITQIQNRDASVTSIPGTQPDQDLALAATAPSLPQTAWGPPGVDELKPVVAPGVNCPYQQVIEGSGERMKQLVDNIGKFAAIEDMLDERLDKTGNPISKETRKFTYVASITEEQPGFLHTDEYRNLSYKIVDLPDHIVTSGTMALALIFHPALRDTFEMTCEGVGDWHGRSAWLVHFRQRDDKPNRFAEYNVGLQHYAMNLKGRAWITTDNLQIVHIDAELLKPLPQLAVQHQLADYGPVHFEKSNLNLWLPQNVDIFMEVNRHYYHRRHSFEHYQLFAVDSVEKSGLSKPDPKTSVINSSVPASFPQNP